MSKCLPFLRDIFLDAILTLKIKTALCIYLVSTDGSALKIL